METSILFPASEAVSTLHQRNSVKQTGATVELIASDVLDHYRTFALLERLLTVPSKLYYDLDDAVIRELLGGGQVWLSTPVL
ncbi:unnamed protein product [Leptidea sinapis]|uniref:Uncharacterized protein n=1 Tax=Leptidea sinapis TaxID=189913 RepID=A0A5E4QNJ7_9NEOP|nr:unnamed protein product [Leptidea sinapis]